MYRQRLRGRPTRPGKWTCSMVGTKWRVSGSCPGDTVNVSGQPCRSQSMWILVVRPPRLRPSAWSMGSFDPPFCRPQRRRGWRESTSSRSSKCPDPSGHLLASRAGAAPGWSRRCRHRATDESGHRRSSMGRSALADRAIWRLSTGSRRSRSALGGHLGEGGPLVGRARRCP